MRNIFLVVSFLLFISGCSESKIEPTPIIKQNGEPNSFNVTPVGEVSDGKIKLLSYGENTTYKSAQDDSKRAALWYVLNSSNNPILQSVQERTKFRNIQKTFYEDVSQFIVSESKIKSKSQSKNNNIVSVEYIIDIEKVKQYLYSQGIIALYTSLKLQDLLISIDKINSVQICVKCDPIKKQLSTILSENGVKVLDNKKIDENLLEILSKQNISDIYWRNSLNVGSDLYITINYDEEFNRLDMEAFFSSTREKISSKKYTYSEVDSESIEQFWQMSLQEFYKSLQKSVESMSQKSKVINVMYEDQTNTARNLESFFGTVCESTKLDTINEVSQIRLDCKYKISTKELADFLTLQKFNMSNIFYSNNVLVFKLN